MDDGDEHRDLERGWQMANVRLWRRTCRQVLDCIDWCERQDDPAHKANAILMRFTLGNVRQWVRDDGPKGLMLAAGLVHLLARTVDTLRHKSGVAEIVRRDVEQRDARRLGAQKAAEVKRAIAGKASTIALTVYRQKRKTMSYEDAVEEAAKAADKSTRTIERYISAAKRDDPSTDIR